MLSIITIIPQQHGIGNPCLGNSAETICDEIGLSSGAGTHLVTKASIKMRIFPRYCTVLEACTGRYIQESAPYGFGAPSHEQVQIF